jgi:hypothetical protein
MSERRNRERKHTARYISVIDRDTDKPMGWLVDLSTEGMRLMGNVSVRSGSVLQLIIKINNTKEILVDAQSRWCQKNDNAELFETGFFFQDITEDNLTRIKELIESPLFKESSQLASLELGG